MGYPSLEQYNLAFQNHSRLLSDVELKAGKLAMTGMGIPLAISGGFALTYTLTTASHKKYAVRCFHREAKGLERRYSAISQKIALLKSPYFLHFEFQPSGIYVDGKSYPIIKMAWAQGETLGEFLDSNFHKSNLMNNLKNAILSLSLFLESNGIAHGDLQTGNIMVSADGASLQLIDYDGMYVNQIASLGSAELGHVNFQHPERKLKNPFYDKLDRFSLISMYLAIHALSIDSSLYKKTNCDLDAVLFRANDFTAPNSSSTFSLVAKTLGLSNFVRNFEAVCLASLEKVPSLRDFLDGKNIPQVLRPEVGKFPILSGYVGAYAVLNASSYEQCLSNVGNKVEVIGKILDVKSGKNRYGKPYIFINFGDWRGNIFKVAIWSEGLAKLKVIPDGSWVNKWVSAIGLMEPPYRNPKFNYSHLSITVTSVGQLNTLTHEDALWRLGRIKGVNTGDKPRAGTGTSNGQILEGILGEKNSSDVIKRTVIPTTPQQQWQPTSSTSANRAILDQLKARSPTTPSVNTSVSKLGPIQQGSVRSQQTNKNIAQSTTASGSGCGWILIAFVIIIFVLAK
ncbi:serine/threonine protein kinase [Shewanella sp. WE21]|uniref:protein kinase family protein n=1 Tax=Shewanella sp. WE21 TaxID=2029986 RepID=UPI000CF65C67|nr:protein kinase family protein [Shewanella sp. WE21]AVI67689.1 serine/threonine protein kinase [Shewanella sp. WE21]